MNEEHLLIAKSNISTTRKTFWWSLGISTALELSFMITDLEALLFVGFFYLLMAILFNFIVFLNNIIFICLHKEARIPLLRHTLLLLLNIPIAYLYLFILFY
ncbi:hypothetical protein HYN59_15720 [Flavobacterium album]|uniref:Uncharacterized protein n=1 Tax=Flavobacterium album TaxID=2175091 RepID=A0A2S1R1H1_9FLAO|nr:hypothetical protein [Flavobacterium album]AWH86467.1 hypothetical protein HYN59_15720 [Flavobacterium album]